MEIYKDLSSPINQKFEKLLNSQLSKNKIQEGKIIDGIITKITEKYIFLFIAGLKSEPVAKSANSWLVDDFSFLADIFVVLLNSCS